MICSLVTRALVSAEIFETKTESWFIFDEPVRPTLPAVEKAPNYLITRHPGDYSRVILLPFY